MTEKSQKKKKIIGWRECFGLEELGLPVVKAKIDTGAKTSSLHAFNIQNFQKDGEEFVSFDIHPLQQNRKIKRKCEAKVVDKRVVSDSGGNREKRFVIISKVKVCNKTFPIEITLANRTTMEYRMLLGREAIKKMRFVVDISKSFTLGNFSENEILELYKI